MKRRILALLLCLFIMGGMFSACGKESEIESFFGLINEMQKISEAEILQTVGISISPKALDLSGMSLSEEDTVDITLNTTGTMSRTNKQLNLKMNGVFALPSMNTTVDISNIIINGNDMYIDLSPVFKLISMFSEDDLSEYFDVNAASKYLKINTMDDMKLDMWAEKSFADDFMDELGTMGTLIKELMGKVVEYVRNADPAYITGEKGAYTLTMDTEAMKGAARIILTDLRDNADKYYDAMVEYVEKHPETMNGMSYSLNELHEWREDGIDSIKSGMDEALTSLDTATDIPDMLFKYTVSKSGKSYVLSCELNCPDMFSITANQTYDIKTIDKFEAPVDTDSMTMEEFSKLMGVPDMDDILDGLDNKTLPDDDYSYDDNNYALLPQNIVQGTANSTFLNADISAHPEFKSVTMTDSEGTPTTLPIPDGESYYENDSYAYIDYDGVSFSYSWDYTLGDEVTVYLNDLISDNYSSMTVDNNAEEIAYAQDPAYSDIWISEDGNTAISSISYTAFGSRYCYLIGYFYSGYDDEFYSAEIIFPVDGLGDNAKNALDILSGYFGVDVFSFVK